MPRNLTLLLPNGRVEYWYTERVFAVDDKIERDDDTWVVTSVGQAEGAAKHMTVTMRRNGDEAS